MAMPLQRTLLTACLLAPRTAAFVGPTGLALHVRVRPAVSSGAPAGAKFLPAKMPPARRPSPAAGASQEFMNFLTAEMQEPVRAEEPVHVNISASRVISDRAEAVSASLEAAYAENQTQAQWYMEDSRVVLNQMKMAIAAGMPRYVFALANQTGAAEKRAEDIRAVALVSSQNITSLQQLASAAQNFGLVVDGDALSATSNMEVLCVNSVVETSAGRQESGAGAELLRKIAHWAATSGRLISLVPSNADLEDCSYIWGLSLIRDELISNGVYRGDLGLATPWNARRFDMVTLDP